MSDKWKHCKVTLASNPATNHSVKKIASEKFDITEIFAKNGATTTCTTGCPRSKVSKRKG